jgi:hypothetical protein
MLAQLPQLDKIASREAFACSALRNVTTPGRARANDKGVVLGNRANLADAAPKGPPLRAMLST